MSLDKIEESLGNIVALKEYPTVLRERNEFAEVVDRQKGQLGERDRVIEEQGKKITECQEDAADLRATHEKLKTSFERSEADNDKLAIRVRELESQMASAEGKTLPEIERIMLAREEAAIERRANKVYEQRKMQWNTSEKPKEVATEAIKQLQIITDELRKAPPHSFPKELADSGAPTMVEEVIEREVKRRVNAEFWKKVDGESEKKAKVKLQQLKKEEWPKFMREQVDPRAAEITSLVRTNFGAFITREFSKQCDRCSTVVSFALTSEGVERLIRFGSISVQCSNENCRDWFGRHSIEIRLFELIEACLTQE